MPLRSLLTPALLGAVGWLLATAPALAQAAGQEPQEGTPWLWVVAIVAGPVLLAAALYYGAAHRRRRDQLTARDPSR